MYGAFTIQTKDKLWPWTHSRDLFSLSHSLFKRWTDWPMCVAGYQNQRNLETDWYVRSVVELHWETCMQVRCQKHGVLLRAICKGYVQSSPSRGAVCSDPKEKNDMSGCLHTANACSYILNLQLYIWGQIHLSIMIWAESLADAWSSRLCHGIDKCNVVLTIKYMNGRKKGMMLGIAICQNSMHYNKL